MAIFAFPSSAIFDSGATGRELMQAADEAAARAAIGVDPSDYGLLDSDNTWTGDNTFDQPITTSEIAYPSGSLKLHPAAGNSLYFQFGSTLAWVMSLGLIRPTDSLGSSDIGTYNNRIGDVMAYRFGATESFKLFNLGDENATNKEYLESSWSTNLAKIETKGIGTGIVRDLQLGTAATKVLIRPVSNQIWLYSNSNARILCSSGGIGTGGNVYPFANDTDSNGLANNRWSTVFSVDADISGTISAGDGLKTAPAYSFSSQSTMGIYRAALNQLALVAGSSRGAVVGTTYLQLGMSSYFAWRGADNIGSGVGNETRIARDGKGIVGLRTYDNSPNAFRVYGDYTDASNGAWLQMDYGVTTAGAATIQAYANGTGANGNLYLRSEVNLRYYVGNILAHNITSTVDRMNVHLEPYFDNQKRAGSSTKRFTEVWSYAGDFAGTVTANAFVGDGSGLTNLPGGGGNPFDQDLNTTDSPSFVDGDFSGTVTTDLIQGGQSQVKLNESASQFLNIWNAVGSIQYYSFRTNAFLPKVSSVQLGLPVSTARWLNVHAVGGSYENLNVETGGSFKLFNLGDSHTNTTNTEFLDISWDTNVATISAKQTGTGVVRDLNFDGHDGNFSGVVTSPANLTLQSNNAQAKISLANSGGVTITALNSIYQQFVATGVSYRQPCHPTFNGSLNLGLETLRWGKTWSVDGSFSGNLSTEVGGSQRVYGLGTEGDTDSHYLQTNYDGSFYRIGALETGAGSNQSLILDYGGSSRLLISSSEVRLYKYLRPSDTTIDIGSVANPFRNVYSVDGSFSENLNVEVGGLFKLFNLGDSHTNTTDTEYLGINTFTNAYGSHYLIRPHKTGTGGNVRMVIAGSSGEGASNLLIDQFGIAHFRYGNTSKFTVSGSYIRLDEDNIRMNLLPTAIPTTEVGRLWNNSGVISVATDLLGTKPSPSFVDGDFSGRVLTTRLENLDGLSYIRVSGLGSSPIKLWRNTAPQGTNSFDMGSDAERFRTVYSVDGSFSENLNVETGGSFKLFNLGDSHTNTTNTEFLKIFAESNSFKIKPEIAGSGTRRALLLQTSYGNTHSNIRLDQYGLLRLRYYNIDHIFIGSGYTQVGVRMYPTANNSIECGLTTNRWSSVNSVNVDLTGTLKIGVGGLSRLYGADDGAGNSVYLQSAYIAGAFYWGSKLTGSGAVADLNFQVGGSNRLLLADTYTQLYRHVQPSQDDHYNMGTSALRWQRFYGVHGDLTGTMTANAFVGDGSGLTNLPSGSSTLASLTDTTVTSPSNGQLLIYNASTSKWVNAVLTSSGGSVTITNGAGTINLEAGGVGPSDRRFKTELLPCLGRTALEKIAKMNPWSFTWDPKTWSIHGQVGQDIGFVAQELEEIDPSLVAEHDEHKMVSYRKLTVMLVSAVQDLQNQINKLKVEK